MDVIARYSWAALVIVGLFWPPAASAMHLGGITEHIIKSDDGTWRQPFTIEVWSRKTGKSTIHRMIFDQDGCHEVSRLEQRTSSLQVPGAIQIAKFARTSHGERYLAKRVLLKEAAKMRSEDKLLQARDLEVWAARIE